MKKILSMLLVFIMCLSMTTIPCFATIDNNTENAYPHIYVHGFMEQDVYIDKDNPDLGTAWPISTNNILSAVSKAIKPLAELSVTKDLDKFGEKAALIVDELFSPVCLNYNGEIENKSGIIFEYPEPEDIKKDSYFKFCYDWRLDPIESAKELDEFVNYILECSGAEKVVLECHSLGGIITLTYFEIYGADKVQSVVFDTTAIYGENYTGELLKSEINLTDKGVKNYLDFLIDGMRFDTFLSCLIGSITDIGVMNYVCEHLNEIVDAIFDEVELSLMKMFANWPTIWAMVPDEMLIEAKENVFSKVYANNNIESSALQRKIDNYSSLIRENRESILSRVNDSTNLYVISRYGYSSLPLTESWQNLSDGVVDTDHNSFGATTAKFGERLDMQSNIYISPDKTIDASTCLFPEQTWFIKNMKHTDGSEKKDK